MLLSVNSIEIDCELVGLHLYRYRSEDVPAVVTLTRKPDAQAVSTVNGSLTGDVHLLEWFDKHEIPEDIQQRVLSPWQQLQCACIFIIKFLPFL